MRPLTLDAFAVNLKVIFVHFFMSLDSLDILRSDLLLKEMKKEQEQHSQAIGQVKSSIDMCAAKWAKKG